MVFWLHCFIARKKRCLIIGIQSGRQGVFHPFTISELNCPAGDFDMIAFDGPESALFVKT
jgi:hypothetical protein